MNSSSLVNQQDSLLSIKVKKLNSMPLNNPAIQIYKQPSKQDQEDLRKLAQLEFKTQERESTECKINLQKFSGRCFKFN